MRITISKKPRPKAKATVAISFFYNKQLSNLDDGLKLFTLLNKYGFFPEKYAALATLRKKKPITFESLSDILTTIWLPFYEREDDNWFLDDIDLHRSKAPKYWGGIDRGPRNPGDLSRPVFHSDISLYMEADSLKKTNLFEELKKLMNDLISYSELDFARFQYYAAEEEETARQVNGEPDTILVARQLSEECLPDLYNVSVWGKPYIEFFGRDKLLSAPCYKVEELPSGIIWMQLAPDVYDEKGCWTGIKDVREKVKAHLNQNAFYDSSLFKRQINLKDLEKDPALHEKLLSGESMKERYKIYKVPKFDLSDIRKPLQIPEKGTV